MPTIYTFTLVVQTYQVIMVLVAAVQCRKMGQTDIIANRFIYATDACLFCSPQRRITFR